MSGYKDRRVLLFLVMLVIFVGWLGAIVFWVFPYIADRIGSADPMMALVTGLGVGGVTQFFMLVLKDGWQFFFRKSGPSAGNSSGSGGGAGTNIP